MTFFLAKIYKNVACFSVKNQIGGRNFVERINPKWYDKKCSPKVINNCQNFTQAPNKSKLGTFGNQLFVLGATRTVARESSATGGALTDYWECWAQEETGRRLMILGGVTSCPIPSYELKKAMI